MTAFLEVQNLTKSYQNGKQSTSVLRGISFQVQAGEALAILGPSGAGKSTLLHILGTLDTPTSGKVLFEGKDLFLKSELERAQFRNKTLGFVFQFHHLLPDFSALENVMMPLLIAGVPKREAKDRALEAMRRVGLENRGHHFPEELSGGESQRIALARALIARPRMILADEPTGNLDTANGSKVFDLLLELNREINSTLLVVTHNEELFPRLGRRALRLFDGLLQNA